MLAHRRALPPGNGAEATTPALRRRIDQAGLGAGQRCRICGCSIDSDSDADRKISAAVIDEGRLFSASGRTLPTQDGWLRGKIVAALRQTPAGQLERRIAARVIEIVGIRVAAGDGENARAQDVFQLVRDACFIPTVRDQPGQHLTQAELLIRT